MIIQFISGENTLADIERAIGSVEFALVRSTGSQIVTQAGVKGNAVSFEETDLIILGELRLLPNGEAGPDGFEQIWTANMVVEGETISVVAWRAGEVGALASAPVETSGAIATEAEAIHDDAPSHSPVIRGTALRALVGHKLP